MKIGILTYHRSHNYGAYMQSYALSQYIKENITDNVEIIDFNMKSAQRLYIRRIVSGNKNIKNIIYNLKKYKMFEKSLDNLPLSKETLISDNINDFIDIYKNKYDIIISGSDEVWKLGNIRAFPNPYWLIGDLSCKKVSYAASSRSDFNNLSNNDKMLIKESLKEFDYIGVRDNATYDSIKEFVIDVNKIHLNCDPTFLYDYNLDKEKGRYILEKKFNIDKNKKVIGFMSADSTICNEIQSNFGCKYSYISLYNLQKNTKSFASLNPFDWANVISSLDFLVTTYYHGMCFALKSNVPFVIIECRPMIDKYYSKSFDLLEKLNLAEQFFMKKEQDKIDKIVKFIDKYIDNTVNYSNYVNSLKNMGNSFYEYLIKEVKKHN